jgi:hypothetical protein
MNRSGDRASATVTRSRRDLNTSVVSVTIEAKATGVSYLIVSAADNGPRVPILLTPTLFIITVGEAGPPPGPGPTPMPPPDPKPPAPGSKLYIAVVRDPGQISPQIAAILGDTTYWNFLKTTGNEWDFYTNAVPAGLDPAEAKRRQGFIDAAKPVQDAAKSPTYVPTIIVAEMATGRVLKAAPLPITKAAINELLAAAVPPKLPVVPMAEKK